METKAVCANDKGSLTIEAILVFSAVLLSISILLFCFMVMYTRILLLNTAVETAEKVANTPGLYEETFAALLSNGQVLFEGKIEKDSFPERKAEQNIEAELYRQLANGLMKPTRIQVKISLENDFLTKTIKVVISEDIKLPFGRIKALGDGRDYLTITGAGRAAIVYPTDYIRNVDLGLEYLYRIKKGETLFNNKKQTK